MRGVVAGRLRCFAFGLAAALLSLSGTPALADESGRTFERAVWQKDYEAIKRGLAQGYANLDWQVDYRGIDLKLMDRQIGAMLERATSEAEAMLALTKMVDAFDDPHLVFQSGPAPASARLLPSMSMVPSDTVTCEEDAPLRRPLRLGYARAKGWRMLAGAPFASGIVGRTGFLRIPSFDEENYAARCQTGAETDPYKRRLALRSSLDGIILKRLAALRAAGADRLVIDLTGNGGGSEWSTSLASRFAAGTLSRTAPRRAMPGCDRSPIWRGDRACAILAPEVTETIQGTAQWTGPLVLLTDKSTASAAEEFVTWLHGNRRVRTVGERSFGAGCGYIDGGSAVALTAAPIHLMMPNCSRFTREGVNEIEGSQPDVPIDWGMASPEAAITAIAAGFGDITPRPPKKRTP